MELISNNRFNDMNFPAFLNIELTSRCNANCWCCGRRKMERDHPDLIDWGDMEFGMAKKIAKQTPPNTVCQFHWNGEPTLYPRLGEVLDLFSHCIRQFNTNGRLILDRFDDIMGHLEVLTISIVEKEEQENQYDIVKQFLDKRTNRKPLLVYRLLGYIKDSYRWGQLEGTICKRILHRPEGSFGYAKPVTIPEIGICLDLLTHLAINRFGEVSVCVRFDPEKKGVIGNFNDASLEDIWNSKIRKYMIEEHLAERRKTLLLCGECDYYGSPTS